MEVKQVKDDMYSARKFDKEIEYILERKQNYLAAQTPITLTNGVKLSLGDRVYSEYKKQEGIVLETSGEGSSGCMPLTVWYDDDTILFHPRHVDFKKVDNK